MSAEPHLGVLALAQKTRLPSKSPTRQSIAKRQPALPSQISHHLISVKPTMVQYIITPWRNQTELLHTRHQLYPDTGKPLDVDDRKQAVAQVSVWMQRGNCPHLVESTAILTSAILNDVPGNSTYCVRAAYSAAFCRYVCMYVMVEGFCLPDFHVFRTFF